MPELYHLSNNIIVSNSSPLKDSYILWFQHSMLKEIKLLRTMYKRKMQTSNFPINFSSQLSDQIATQCAAV